MATITQMSTEVKAKHNLQCGFIYDNYFNVLKFQPITANFRIESLLCKCKFLTRHNTMTGEEFFENLRINKILSLAILQQMLVLFILLLRIAHIYKAKQNKYCNYCQCVQLNKLIRERKIFDLDWVFINNIVCIIKKDSSFNINQNSTPPYLCQSATRSYNMDPFVSISYAGPFETLPTCRVPCYPQNRYSNNQCGSYVPITQYATSGPRNYPCSSNSPCFTERGPSTIYQCYPFPDPPRSIVYQRIGHPMESNVYPQMHEIRSYNSYNPAVSTTYCNNYCRPCIDEDSQNLRYPPPPHCRQNIPPSSSCGANNYDGPIQRRHPESVSVYNCNNVRQRPFDCNQDYYLGNNSTVRNTRNNFRTVMMDNLTGKLGNCDISQQSHQVGSIMTIPHVCDDSKDLKDNEVNSLSLRCGRLLEEIRIYNNERDEILNTNAFSKCANCKAVSFYCQNCKNDMTGKLEQRLKELTEKRERLLSSIETYNTERHNLLCTGNKVEPTKATQSKEQVSPNIVVNKPSSVYDNDNIVKSTENLPPNNKPSTSDKESTPAPQSVETFPLQPIVIKVPIYVEPNTRKMIFCNNCGASANIPSSNNIKDLICCNCGLREPTQSSDNHANRLMQQLPHLTLDAVSNYRPRYTDTSCSPLKNFSISNTPIVCRCCRINTVNDETYLCPKCAITTTAAEDENKLKNHLSKENVKPSTENVTKFDKDKNDHELHMDDNSKANNDKVSTAVYATSNENVPDNKIQGKPSRIINNKESTISNNRLPTMNKTESVMENKTKKDEIKPASKVLSDTRTAEKDKLNYITPNKKTTNTDVVNNENTENQTIGIKPSSSKNESRELIRPFSNDVINTKISNPTKETTSQIKPGSVEYNRSKNDLIDAKDINPTKEATSHIKPDNVEYNHSSSDLIATKDLNPTKKSTSQIKPDNVEYNRSKSDLIDTKDLNPTKKTTSQIKSGSVENNRSKNDLINAKDINPPKVTTSQIKPENVEYNRSKNDLIDTKDLNPTKETTSQIKPDNVEYNRSKSDMIDTKPSNVNQEITGKTNPVSDRDTESKSENNISDNYPPISANLLEEQSLNEDFDKEATDDYNFQSDDNKDPSEISDYSEKPINASNKNDSNKHSDIKFDKSIIFNKHTDEISNLEKKFLETVNNLSHSKFGEYMNARDNFKRRNTLFFDRKKSLFKDKKLNPLDYCKSCFDVTNKSYDSENHIIRTVNNCFMKAFKNIMEDLTQKSEFKSKLSNYEHLNKNRTFSTMPSTMSLNEKMEKISLSRFENENCKYKSSIQSKKPQSTYVAKSNNILYNNEPELNINYLNHEDDIADISKSSLEDNKRNKIPNDHRLVLPSFKINNHIFDNIECVNKYPVYKSKSSAPTYSIRNDMSGKNYNFDAKIINENCVSLLNASNDIEANCKYNQKIKTKNCTNFDLSHKDNTGNKRNARFMSYKPQNSFSKKKRATPYSTSQSNSGENSTNKHNFSMTNLSNKEYFLIAEINDKYVLNLNNIFKNVSALIPQDLFLTNKLMALNSVNNVLLSKCQTPFKRSQSNSCKNNTPNKCNSLLGKRSSRNMAHLDNHATESFNTVKKIKLFHSSTSMNNDKYLNKNARLKRPNNISYK